MAEERRAPSKVIPVLVAVLVCDAAVADPTTGKKNLIGIFDRIWVRTFPTERPVTVYVKLTDAEGLYKLEVRYIQVTTGNVLAGAVGEIVVPERRRSVDALIEFPPLAIPDAGRYEFQVRANDVYLGGTFLDAVLRT